MKIEQKVLRFIFSFVIPLIFASLIFLNLPLVCGHHDHNSEHGHSHKHVHINENPSYKWSKQANEEFSNKVIEPDNTPVNNVGPELLTNVWTNALGATILISIAPYLILFFIRVSNTKEHEPHLKVLLAFAAGGLLGDAFLHLIPHALMSVNQTAPHSHSHAHSHSDESHSHDNTVGISVLAGIITFLIVEKFVRIFSEHSHSHGGSKDKTNKSDEVDSKKEKKVNGKGKKTAVPAVQSMKVAGYLNLAADFTHNLTDGLAIGASFMAGKSIGIVTTFTIFLHEIPHEIGDFAILLQSGCSRKKAMMLQLVTALGAVIGTCISLIAGGSGAASVAWILPFTAGGFIYIAAVSVIPELLENSSLWQSVREIVAILMGISLMIGITWLEAVSN